MKLYSALRPLVIVSRFLGLFPALQEGSSSKLQDLYCCIVFLVILGINLFLTTHYWQGFSKYRIPELCEMSQTLGKFLCYCFCIPICILMRGRLLELVGKIRTLDAKLGVNYVRLRKVVVVKLVLGLIVSIASNLKGVSRMSDVKKVLYLCVTDFLIYAVLVVSIQFITFISVSRKFFEAINCMLMGYEGDGKAMLNKSKVNPMPTRIQVLECQVSEFGYRATLGIGTELLTRSSEGITILMRLQDEACDITSMANSIYSMQLLASLAVVFVTLTVHTYAIVSSLVEKGDNSSTPFLVVSVLFQAVQLLWLTYCCNSTRDEANRTATLVHKLLSKTRNPELKEQLQLFSLQLLHRKVQFTACGFFPLDFTLLYSIVGAVTTYLVILIQFQMSFSGSSKTSTSLSTIYTETFTTSMSTSIIASRM